MYYLSLSLSLFGDVFLFCGQAGKSIYWPVIVIVACIDTIDHPSIELVATTLHNVLEPCSRNTFGTFSNGANNFPPLQWLVNIENRHSGTWLRLKQLIYGEEKTISMKNKSGYR